LHEVHIVSKSFVATFSARNVASTSHKISFGSSQLSQVRTQKNLGWSLPRLTDVPVLATTDSSGTAAKHDHKVVVKYKCLLVKCYHWLIFVMGLS
jgi:hypothetical protein